MPVGTWMKAIAVWCAGLGLLTTTALAADPISIEVALGDVSLNKVPFLVAGDNGIYEKNGLKIRQYITPSAAERIRRSGVDVPAEFVKNAKSDNAPISIGGGSPLIVAMTTDARATERVIVATTDSRARFHIIGRTDLNGAADLKGKRLGYSSYGSVSHLMAMVFLRKMGWNSREDISLMGEGMAYEALKKGRVDAFIGSEIYYTMAAKNGAKTVVDLATYDIAIAGSGINVERQYLADNREAVRRFVKATVEAYALLATNRQVANNVLAKWYRVTDPKQQEQMYAQVATWPRKPFPAVDGIKQVMAVYDHRELRRRKVEDFYDASFIEELDKSGFIDGLYKK